MSYTLKEIVDDTRKEVVGFEVFHDDFLVIHYAYHQFTLWTSIEKIRNVHVVMDDTKIKTYKKDGIIEIRKKDLFFGNDSLRCKDEPRTKPL